MKIACFTLCRERLAYTRECLRLLALNAGHSFVHVIVDNGSEDGTAEWIEKYAHENGIPIEVIDGTG